MANGSGLVYDDITDDWVYLEDGVEIWREQNISDARTRLDVQDCIAQSGI